MSSLDDGNPCTAALAARAYAAVGVNREAEQLDPERRGADARNRRSNAHRGLERTSRPTGKRTEFFLIASKASAARPAVRHVRNRDSVDPGIDFNLRPPHEAELRPVRTLTTMLPVTCEAHANGCLSMRHACRVRYGRGWRWRRCWRWRHGRVRRVRRVRRCPDHSCDGHRDGTCRYGDGRCLRHDGTSDLQHGPRPCNGDCDELCRSSTWWGTSRRECRRRLDGGHRNLHP